MHRMLASIVLRTKRMLPSIVATGVLAASRLENRQTAGGTRTSRILL
jgi:hypothetical protein